MKFRRNHCFKLIWIFEYMWTQSFGGALVGGCFGGFMWQICGGMPTLECDFNKAAWLLCWGHILVWVFSCEFSAFFFLEGGGVTGGFHESTSGGLLLRTEYIYIFPSTHLTHYMCILKHKHFIYFSIFSGLDDKT